MNLDSASPLVTGKGLSLVQALEMGGQTTVLGLCIVFGVLVILMIVLYLFGVIFNKKPKEKAAPAPAASAPAPVEAAPVEEEDEEELIAILTAAVAASLNTSTYNLQIKSYRRVPTKRPAWNSAGLRETIGNRL